jgi:hypothetical protein
VGALYKIFDRFTEMIPPQLLPILRMAAVLGWAVMAVVVVAMAWQRGGESAPQVGQELSLAEIKARQQREANLKKPQNVRVPDLNELIPQERAAPLQFESQRDRARGELPDPGPVYAGEGLAPLEPPASRTAPLSGVGPQDYRPERDSGVGGQRERLDNRSGAGPVLPLEPEVGLDGKPLKRHSEATAPARSPHSPDPEASAPAAVIPDLDSDAGRSSGSRSGGASDLPLLD